ncbi:MAG: DMT family transporter [Actinomycetota bacterium]|nr:DMT family transporter [Actinomycetota bacterium]
MSDRPAPRSGRPNNDLAGSGLAVLMGVEFAFVVVLGKGLLRGQPPFALLFFRFAGAAVILAVVTIATRRPLTPEPGERLGLALAATLGYGSESALYFAALNHGSAATVTLLFYLYPVWVMLTAIVLDRRIPAGRLVTALAMAIVGSAIVVVGGSGVEIAPIGIVLAISCSLTYTGYLTAADRVLRRTNPLTTAAWLAAGASVANLIYALAFHGWSTPAGAFAGLRVFGMGAFTAAAFVCMIASLQLIGAVRNAIIGVLEPLSVAVLAAAFLDEPISTSTAIGGGLILAAAVVAILARGARVVEPDL